MLHGFLVVDSRSGVLLYAQRFSSAYGLASFGQLAHDEIRLSAMLFALHLHAASASDDRGGLTSFRLPDATLTFAALAAPPLLLLLSSHAAAAAAAAAHLAHQLLAAFAARHTPPLPRAALRHALAPSLHASLHALPSWALTHALTHAPPLPPLRLRSLAVLHAPQLPASLPASPRAFWRALPPPLREARAAPRRWLGCRPRGSARRPAPRRPAAAPWLYCAAAEEEEEKAEEKEKEKEKAEGEGWGGEGEAAPLRRVLDELRVARRGEAVGRLAAYCAWCGGEWRVFLERPPLLVRGTVGGGAAEGGEPAAALVAEAVQPWLRTLELLFNFEARLRAKEASARPREGAEAPAAGGGGGQHSRVDLGDRQ
ncbi:hypothetical protein AB1Y20_021788 [Prymnesium parvum]|uniref:Uncharacterized protein n=1 Tax=Prymnesium parvum TaxID=97485 RepID=A0AB34JJR4_PRYPA